jgi:large subunit ribosomal protein L4
MEIKLYSQDGTEKDAVKVSERVFGAKTNKALVHKIMVMQLGNRRAAIAHTKTKGEVSGGGKKPYRQKGTGRARQGSTRNPQFRGGGIAFGPRNVRNFVVHAPKKERRNALFGVLSDKFREAHVSALENFASDKAKTKDFAQMLKKLPFKKSVLFVLPAKNEMFVRSSKNIPKIKSIMVNYLNVVDLLKYNDIVFLKDSLPKIEEIFV